MAEPCYMIIRVYKATQVKEKWHLGIRTADSIKGGERGSAYLIFINLNSSTSTIRCCKCIVVIYYFLLRGFAAPISQKNVKPTARSIC